MACLTLAEVKRLADSLFGKISEQNDLDRYIHFGPTFEDCMLYVDIDDKGYHIKCFERGNQIQNDVTRNIDELLYWIFRSVTSSISMEYELKNRIRYQDNRRLMFSKQLELMEKINTDFLFKCRLEIQDILENHPYDDANSTKLDLVDDFERMLKKVDARAGLKSVISQTCVDNVAKNIGMIRQSHETGTHDLDEFIFELFTACKSIYSELVDVHESITDIEEIKNDFQEIFLIAESALGIAH